MRDRRLFLTFVAGIALFGLATTSTAQGVPFRGVVIDEALGAPTRLPSDAHIAGADGILFVRLSLPSPSPLPALDSTALGEIDARLSQYARQHLPVILALGRLPDGPADADAWTSRISTLATHLRGKIAGYQFGEIGGTLPAPEIYTYMLQRTAVQIRSIDPAARIVQGAIPSGARAWLAQVYALNSAPYVDAVAVADAGGLGDLIKQQDPTASVIAGPIELGDGAAAVFCTTLLKTLGTDIDATAFRGTPAGLAAALAAGARLADLLHGEVVSLDTPVTLTRAGIDVTARVPHRLLFSPSNASTYLVYEAAEDTGTIDVSLNVSTSAPAVRDPLSGAVDRLPVPASTTSQERRLTVRQATHPLILDFDFQVTRFMATAGVSQSVLPPVEEIIARHQQARAAEDAALHNYIARSRITLDFHLSAADPAHHVMTDNQLFVGPGGTEWLQQRFSMDGATWTKDPPAFPLLQAEKVLSLPLDLRLSRDYRYELEGVESIDGRDAFVVRFDPVDAGRALYRGRVWIDRQSFVRLRISAVQTHLDGSITSSEEEQSFSRVGDIDGLPIWLPAEQTVRQSLLLAGKTVLLERRVRLSDIELNAPDFTSRQADARATDNVMYRDTDQGLRNFVKRDGRRVATEHPTQSTRALVFGVDVDPSLDSPLPLAGLDMVDFDFLHKGLQFSLVFGGVVGYATLERAGLGRGRFDASVDFYGLAVKSTDKVFTATGEDQSQRIETRPAVAGATLAFHATSSLKLTGRYEFRYDAYSSAATTAAAFAVPASGTSMGIGGGYEFSHRGYVVTGHAMTYRRQGWSPWGSDPSAGATGGRYTLYDAGVSKDVALSSTQTIHVNGQYFGGTDLDRFNMYQFGLLDPARMHGVPWTLRFESLAMLRTSYSFNVGNYRFEVFGEAAAGCDSRIDTAWRPITGIGVALNMRGPFSTLVKIDVGKSFLPALYQAAGSHVIQVMVLKPF